jgi:hypothetical protein
VQLPHATHFSGLILIVLSTSIRQPRRTAAVLYHRLQRYILAGRRAIENRILVGL